LDAEAAVGEATPDVGVGYWAYRDSGGVVGELRGHRGVAVVTVQGHVVRYQEAAGRPLDDLDREVQLVPVHGSPAADLDDTACVLVDPAAAARRHLVRRGHVEQVGTDGQLGEDPPARAVRQGER